MGTVVSTRKDEALQGMKFLAVEELGRDMTPTGRHVVAVDAVWNVLNSFTLSAIPLFIMLGEIMLRSGVSAV